MHRLMYRTLKRQCLGPCALILCVWYLTAVTFPNTRPHTGGKFVPHPRDSRGLSTIESTTNETQASIHNLHHPNFNDTLATKSTPEKINNLNPHNFNYTINNPSTCEETSVFILIFVHSAPDHFAERKLIRATWASLKTYQGKSIRTIFLLAQPTNFAVQADIVRENVQHEDIIQENFVDHYRNLTHKHIMGLKWVSRYCSHAQTVVKVDDDTFVHIFRIVQFLSKDNYFSRQNTSLSSMNINSDIIYYSVYRNHSPRRDKSDKWYVSREEYPGDKYPPWCEGFAYITKPHLVRKLYDLSLRTQYYWIDDVYVTGILAEKFNVTHRQFRNPYGYEYLFKSKPPHDNVIFLLEKYVRNTQTWMKIWNVISDVYLS